MAPHKEYLDDDEAYGGKNGKQPEEISMVPKIGWSDGKGSYGKDDYSGEELHCGAGSFRPGFLQGFKKVWVFALISGMTSLFAEYVHVFLVSQIPYLKRQFDLKDNAINMLTLPSPIASLFTVLFLSVIARRVHIPRALALTSLIAGVCSLLCIIPHLTSHTDLTPPPLKNETTKLTVEKLMFDMPSCVMDRIDPDLIQKTQKIIFQAKMRAMTKAMVENSKKPRAPTPQTKTKDAPTVAAMVASAATTASLRAPKPKPANSDSGGKQPTAPAPTNPTAPPTTVAPTTIVPQGLNIGFGCDQPIINKGLTVDNKTGMTCGQSCSCFDLGYAPVCGSDGITYYSACHAGCGYPHKGKFHDCKCLSDEVKTVTPEFCEQPCMWAYWLFQLVMLIGAFSLGLRFVPLLVSSYRCVDSQDIPVAVGLKMFYVILFSYIAAPYIYKHLEDGTCTLQRPECGIFPTCAIYDIVSYRLRIFVTSFVLELVGALLLLIAFLIGKRPSSKFNERVSDK